VKLPSLLHKSRNQLVEPDVQLALVHLYKSSAIAVGLDLPPWELANELPNLLASGVTDTSLRVLVINGLAEHRIETSRPNSRNRTFRPAANLHLVGMSCFILTSAGIELAQKLVNGEDQLRVDPGDSSANALTPHFDSSRRILSFHGKTVKRFRVPADNQELILQAFQEEGWPYHLDDPLPRQPGSVPQKRLHDTIRRLNANQTKPLIFFEGDGRGRGINWRQIDA
jgi:hypothetical protein